MNITFYSPMEIFEVVNLFGINIPLFNINLTLTNLGVFAIVAITLIIVSFTQGMNEFKLVQSRFSLLLESVYATVYSIVIDQLGSRNLIYLPFILSLFTFILVANLIGNVGYTFTVTSSAIVCFGLSFLVWMGATILGLTKHGLHFASLFVPNGCPLVLVPFLALIELVSYCVRVVSLGVRLMANIISGHSLIIIVGGFMYKGFSNGILSFVITLLPFSIFLGIVGLEIAVSFIQAFVFALLASSYLKDAADLH